MNLVLFLVAINLFKLIAAPYFPLIGDEAYYWLWSKHLALGYADHPPMIAYINFILTSIFGNYEIVIRIGAILIVLLISWIIYLIGKELFNKQTGTAAAIIFNLIPTFFGGGMFLVPQMPFFLFWASSFYLLVKIIKSNQPGYWYLLGITAGLGLLSDYVMLFFFLGTLIFLFCSRDHRHWLARKEPYLAAFLSLTIFSPLIIWNLNCGLASLYCQGDRFNSGQRVTINLLNFFGLQMIMYTPTLFFMTMHLIFHDGWKSLKLNEMKNLLFSIFSAVVFLPFAIISPLINIGGHWPAAAYLPAIINSPRAKKSVLISIICFALLVDILAFTYYLFLYPTPKDLAGRECRVNYELPTYLSEFSQEKGRCFILSNNLGLAGLVSFHGKVRVYLPPGRHRQYDIWGKPELQKGDNAIFFALGEPEIQEKLKTLFKNVTIDRQVRIFAKDASIPTDTHIFLCREFIGKDFNIQ